MAIAARAGERVNQSVDAQCHAREPHFLRHKVVDQVARFLFIFHFLLITRGGLFFRARLGTQAAAVDSVGSTVRPPSIF